MPSLPPDHVQLEFPKRADVHAHKRAQGRDVRNPTITCVWSDGTDCAIVRQGTPLRGILFLLGSRPLRFHIGPMNILSGSFDQPDISPSATVSEMAPALAFAQHALSAACRPTQDESGLMGYAFSV